MKTTIQETAAYQLQINLKRGAYGTQLTFTTLVPMARRPEEQVKFQLLLSDAELKTLAKVLSEAVASATI